MISREEFHKLFAGTFWKHLCNSIVPYSAKDKPLKKEFLDRLYEDICAKKYYPDLPRTYIIYDKQNRVSRIVPVFGFRENCVYFYCIKTLEDYIAINRVEGTFGGWTLGNPVRRKEETEILDSSLSPAPIDSYNPFKWQQNWRDFQKRAYQFSKKDNYSFFLKFDLANFYDTINLNILESKIRLITTKDEAFAIDLLFHFLKNWNRRFENYAAKSVGIPQDIVGDCSRILANFFLQDYDQFVKAYCDKHSAYYMRYADDQIVMTRNKEDARDILFEASKELFKINLNMNATKVIEFKTRAEFFEYWAFDIFELLNDSTDKVKINQAVELYIQRRDAHTHFKEDSVLRRILSVTNADFEIIDAHMRHKLLAEFLEPDFLVRQDHWVLNKLASILKDKTELFSILDAQIEKIHFNSFHYNLLAFYKTWRKDFSEEIILGRIAELDLRIN